MKTMKLLTSIVLSASLLVLAGCGEKFLDVEPPTQISQDVAFSTIDNMFISLNGVYAAAPGVPITTFDVMADNAKITPQTLGSLAQEYAWTFTAGGSPGNWGGAYSGIANGNNIINAIQDGYSEGTEDQRNQILGECLALRAYAYHILVRAFGPDPALNPAANDALGVPVVRETRITTPARNTVGEVYDLIFEDIERALTLVTQEDRSGIKINFGPSAIAALGARVALYAGRWDLAAAYAQQVINSGRYSLEDSEAGLEALFLENESSEIIWRRRNLTAGIGTPLFNPNLSIIEIAPTADLINLYDRGNDIRFNAYFNPSPFPGAQVDFYSAKYLGRPGLSPGVSDTYVFRLPEMYLIQAEALARLGQDANARTALDQLRRSRIRGFSSGNESGQALLRAIENERRKELCFEGHRWFDLKRNGQPVVREDCNTALTPRCRLEADDFRFLLPIPQRELQANPNIVQNPGY
ncbi:MAG: RagB/SusD family nutrient uptake outer membrane protein [Bernardetiaceae bacterium]|nr:RagB/SusD family nutrient uptake outer membrane protein [Bernardetiaceae bacterium]